MNARTIAIFTASALLAACSGGGGGSSSPTTATAPAPGAPVIPVGPVATATAGPGQSSGTLVIVINRSSPASSAKVRRPAYVSPSTYSVGISINGSTPYYADVNANSSLCTTSGSVETCSIPIAAPAGSDTIGLTFYDAINGTGNLLGTGTAPVTVTIGTPFTVTIPIEGVVASVTFSITPGSVQGPNPATATLTATALDADGNAIGGTTPYSNPIAVTDNDTTGAITLSSTSITSPTSSITVTYSGAAPTTSTTFTTSSVTTVTPATLAIPPPHQSLFVSDQNAATTGVYVFAPGANGNATPIRAITGSNTLMGKVGAVALDAAGNIYVSNTSSATITVYAPDANGNVAPIRTIAGSSTGFVTTTDVPWGLAIDGSGDLFAALYNGSTFNNGAAVEFAPGATGNVAPIALIGGAVALNPNSNNIAVDAAGEVYEANTSPAAPLALLAFAPGSNGNVPPTRNITGSAAFPTSSSVLFQVAFDASGNVVNAVDFGNASGGAVDGWPLTATGNVAPSIQITGSNTGIGTGVRGVAFDASGNLYVSELNAARTASSILVFAPGSNGNVAPIRTISGTSIGVVQSEFIAVSP